MTREIDDLIRDLSDAEFYQRPQGQVAHATKTAFQAKDQLIAIGKDSVWPVIECLMSQSPKHQRAMAAQVLGEIGDTDAVNALIDKLHNPEMVVRGFSAEALGKIGDERAVGPLREILNREGEVSDVKAFVNGALIRFEEIIALTEPRMEKETLWKIAYYFGMGMVIFICISVGTLSVMGGARPTNEDLPWILGCVVTPFALGCLLIYLASLPKKPKDDNG